MARQRIVPMLDGAPLAYGHVLRLWSEDPGFRDYFIALLADAPHAAFYWETPPVGAATADREFEFVLLDAPSLARRPDALAFSAHFRATAESPMVTFANLSGDATLVVPCPRAAPSAYASLAPFLREAPPPQRHALWQAIGVAMQARLGDAPVWLSTAGDGVAWLHVRLDRRPKYYRFAPYRFAQPERFRAG